MARPAPIIPVDGKMYRHFAIATVLITGCLAMFASGENRQALAESIESQQRNVEAQQVEQQTAKKKGIGKKGNFTDNRKVKGSFGTDAELRWKPPRSAFGGAGFAQSSEAELVAGSEVAFTGDGESGSPTVVGQLPPGMSPAEWEQMTNKKKKKKAPPQSRAMTAQEVDAMMTASDARSLTRQD